MKLIQKIALFVIVFGVVSCKKDKTQNQPKLIIKLVVDSTQARLGNLGTPVEFQLEMLDNTRFSI